MTLQLVDLVDWFKGLSDAEFYAALTHPGYTELSSRTRAYVGAELCRRKEAPLTLQNCARLLADLQQDEHTQNKP